MKAARGLSLPTDLWRPFMKVSIIGAGLIGARRAHVAQKFGDEVVSVFDTDLKRGRQLAEEIGAQMAPSATEAIQAAAIVVIATPNKFLTPLALQALQAGRHVLIEKPMGRNVEEAFQIFTTLRDCRGVVFKVGFNHRYHPALLAAHKALTEGRIGKPTFIRAVYGHGGRPGYEQEWRGNAELAGGGELTDQGVHLLDLICWFMSRPDWVFAQRRTFVWPLQELEDNGFFTLGWADGRLAQVHTSWTQWKNRFVFQVYGTRGAVEIEGLGGSYGEERLTISVRKAEGGIPDVNQHAFPAPDESWEKEWQDFRQAIQGGGVPMGHAGDGLNTMAILDAVYKSCAAFSPVSVEYIHPAAS